MTHARRKETARLSGVFWEAPPQVYRCNNAHKYVIIRNTVYFLNACAARIDDRDEGFETDDWQYETRELGFVMEALLRSNRWWTDLGGQGDNPSRGRCLGIRCNILARAQRRRDITHQLLGGGSHNISWGALRWQEMVGTDKVRFGKLRKLHYLPKKIANFLHEFHAEDFRSLNLPSLPSDRGHLDASVHAMLRPMDIAILLRRLQV